MRGDRGEDLQHINGQPGLSGHHARVREKRNLASSQELKRGPEFVSKRSQEQLYHPIFAPIGIRKLDTVNVM